MPASENFVLRSTLTSPFGRKVRMAIEVLGLTSRVTVTPADPLDENDTLRQQNPLGKMPCLVLPDGSTIYDSGIIIEFLQDVAGTDRLLPLRGLERFKALTLSRLADGIMDASILVVYESRFRLSCRIRRVGSRINAAKSDAGWTPSTPPHLTLSKLTWFRSACHARSAISTGANRWTGVRLILVLSIG